MRPTVRRTGSVIPAWSQSNNLLNSNTITSSHWISQNPSAFIPENGGWGNLFYFIASRLIWVELVFLLFRFMPSKTQNEPWFDFDRSVLILLQEAYRPPRFGQYVKSKLGAVFKYAPPPRSIKLYLCVACLKCPPDSHFWSSVRTFHTPVFIAFIILAADSCKQGLISFAFPRNCLCWQNMFLFEAY